MQQFFFVSITTKELKRSERSRLLYL